VIELRGVSVGYGTRSVLEGLDLSIGDAERVCLLGPNGAGKSTLLRCLTGLVPPSRGAVLHDGVPIEELGRERLARRVAVVPGQVVLPFSMRVEDAVALGRIPHEHPFRGMGPADHAAVDAAISRVGIDELRRRDARQLSLGERQLVLLAMALAQHGRVLVLDEPTVHLDLGHQVAVMQLLTDLNERDGLTIVAVLHDLGLAAQFFPRLVLLDQGRVVADGTPAEVLTPDRIRDVYGVDSRFVPAVPQVRSPRQPYGRGWS
jgi:iron complex transport system ATP-binding protein